MLLILLHQVSKHNGLYSQEFCKKFFIVKRSWKIPAPHPVRHTCSQPQIFQLGVIELSVWASYQHMGKSGFLISHGWLFGHQLTEGRNLPCSFLDQGVFLSIMWVLVQGPEPYAPACLLPCGMRWICLLRTELPAKLQSSFYMFLRTGLTRCKRNE